MALSDSVGILFRLKGDSSDAVRAFNQVEREQTNLTKTSASLSGSLAGMINPATLAAAAVAGIGIAAVAVGKGLFNLAQSASEYGSEIFDATEKTGLAAETISSLKVAADQSGTSLDAVTGGLGRFAKTIGDAGDGSDKAQAKLNKLGVTSKDLDTALAQALTTIAKYPPGVEQMTAAQAAFGKSGADLLPFIKSFDGDLPALIAKCKELGLTMSDENAKAADDFGDQMDTLSSQLKFVGITIGTELMPVFTEMARDISNWLVENKGEIKSWGEFFAKVLRGLAKDVRLLMIDYEAFRDFGSRNQPGNEGYEGRAAHRQRQREVLFQDFQVLEDGRQIGGEGRGRVPGKTGVGDDNLPAKKVKREGDRARTAWKEIWEWTESMGFTPTSGLRKKTAGTTWAHPSGFSVDVSIAKKTVEQQAAFALAALEAGYRVVDERVRKLSAASTAKHFHLERNDNRASNFDFDLGYAGISKERLLEADRRRMAGKLGETSYYKELDKRKEAEEKLAKDIAEIQIRSAEDTEKRKFEIGQRTIQFLIIEAERLAKVEGEVGQDDAQIEALKEASRLRLQLLRDEIIELERLETVKEEAAAKELNEAKALALLNEAAGLRNTIEIKTIELQQEEIAQSDSLLESITQIQQFREDLTHRLREYNEELQRKKELEFEGISQKPDLLPGETGPFDLWTESWNEFVDSIESRVGNVTDSLSSMAGMLQNAFQSVAQAIGSVIQQWVLYGNTGPAVMRKILASALATIAAEAAVQAIYATALGFILLAQWDFVAAGNAFVSAALWASVAGVAAIAGRAVAGNAFAQQTANGGAGASASSSGVGGSNRNVEGQGRAFSGFGDEAQVVEHGRNSPFRSEVVLSIRDRSDWFAQMFTLEVKNNTQLRTTLRDAFAGG